MVNSTLKKLNFIRIGTSGTVQPDIAVDSLLISEAAIGLDALMHYYVHHLTDEQQHLLDAFTNSLPADFSFKPYLAIGDEELIDELGYDLPKGITITSPGFYAPQGRQIRAQATVPQLLQLMQQFSFNHKRITNLEMETSGIYNMARALGHGAISFNVLLANRITHQFSTQPVAVMNKYIAEIMERIVK